MLTSLHIENLAVVKEADLQPAEGFTVLTGETGAGKSMVLDAIHLLVGERGKKEQIRTGQTQTTVCGMFEHLSPHTLAELEALGVAPDADGVLYLQRTLYADGKNRVLLNGRPIPLSLQREIGLRLVNIHGQHDNYALLSESKHKDFLDTYADHADLLAAYRADYEALTATRRALATCARDEREKLRRTEQLKEQIAEIEAAKLKEDEEEALLAKRTRLRNAEKIQKQTTTVYRALYRNERGASAYELSRIAMKSLSALAEYLPDTPDLLARLEVCASELQDVAETVHDALQGESEHPERLLDQIEGRLALLHKLQRKYGADNAQVIAFCEKAKEELAEMEQSEARCAELTALLEKQIASATASASALHQSRLDAATRLGAAICAELAFLEMAKVRFEVAVEPIAGEDPFTADGCDKIAFLVATNTGEPLRPLVKIASGGELSRIMLALKCVLQGADGVQTMIFDEIDTGISGKISQKVGWKLKQTAQGAQVLCVTHAAQIAALADRHILVSKADVDGRTETSLTTLFGQTRVRALASMMGGAEITETLLSSARELMEAKPQQA